MIITVFDFESTGLFSNRLVDDDKLPEAIEFAAIKYNFETEEVIKESNILIKPKKLIPHEITEITSITNEMVANAKSFADHVPEIRDMLENTDAVCAHNLSYDKELADVEFNRLGLKVNWPNRLICTVEQSYPLKGYRLSLANLHAELGLGGFKDAHRAIADVRALVNCVKFLKTLEYI